MVCLMPGSVEAAACAVELPPPPTGTHGFGDLSIVSKPEGTASPSYAEAVPYFLLYFGM